MGTPLRGFSSVRAPAAIAAGIVAIAFLLRVFRIGEQELWYDEAFSFHMATVPTGLWEALRIENSPPLYYLLLRAWVSVAGVTESAVRLPSAFFGTLDVVAVIAAGWRLFNSRVGLWAGAVMTASPLHVYYSQEARGYTLLIFALLMTYILLVRALERPSRGAWFVTGLAALAAVYTHYWTLIGILPSVLLLGWWPSPQPLRARISGYLQAALVMAMGIIPWMVWCFALMTHPFAVGDFLSTQWERTPPALAIPKSFELMGIGHQADTYPNLAKIFPALEFPPSLRLIALGLFSLLAVWTIVPWGDLRLKIPEVGRRKAFLWAWCVIPLAVLWLISLFRPVYVVGRYDLIAFPAFILLVGLALAKIQSIRRGGHILAGLTGLILFSLMGLKMHLYYQAAGSVPITPSARETALAVATRVKTGDIAAFDNTRGASILYYLHRLGYRWEHRECRNHATGVRFGCRIFPPEDEVAYGLPDDPLQPKSFVRQLLFSLKGPDNALWVVAEPTYISDSVFLQEFMKLDVGMTRLPVQGGAQLFQFTPR